MDSGSDASIIKENHTLNILVVEDDLFQRLLINELLETYDYEVSLAANGKIALEMLMKESSTYDLILLDYMMPEMDGLELLTYMQSNEKLKHIPVIMMSSNGEEQSVAKCLKHGAKDYFIKPVRGPNLKLLVKYINLKDREPSLLEYDIIRPIGSGASGSVHLARSIEDNKLYALKKIELRNKNPVERKLAENELTLLRVLDSPTIIHYYKDFTQNQTIHIIMEYAEGGSLDSVIKEHRQSGKPISNDQILDWLAQIVLGLSLTHSKNILHRDIKPENIFLTKDKIAKLGDFGISKALSDSEVMAKTMCGTPYYMSPEVCNHEPYNQKSDIWSLGCSIYELATLKRPFDGENIDDLKRNIFLQEPDALPSHVDPKINMLVYLMMSKEKEKRPNVFQLAHIECVRERIVKFLQDHNLDMSLLPPKDISKPSFPMNRLAEIAWNIRNSIELRSVTVKLFTKLKNVVSGEDLYKWFTTHLNFDYQEKIETVIDAMMQQEILFSPSGSRHFQNSPNVYYQFQMDRPGIAANMTKIFKGQARQGLQVSRNLIEKMNEVLKEIMDKKDNNSDELIINNSKLNTSKSFVEFVEASSELQAIQISSLQRDEKIACFLNIYQIMQTHKILKDKSSEESKGGLADKIQSLVKSDSAPFYYIVGQMEFNLDDIRHGILRGNKKAPNAYYFKSFSDNDLRSKIVQIEDPRIVMLFNLETKIPAKLQVFDSVKLDDQLDAYCREYLDKFVDYDPIDKTLILPNVFKTYRKDFGSQPELITFIKQYTKVLKNVPDTDIFKSSENISITYYEKTVE